MAQKVLTEIIQKRELKNEKMVAIVRFLLGLSIIFDILSYFNVIPLSETKMTLAGWMNSIFLLTYSTAVLLLLHLRKNVYLKWLKYVVVLLDYVYVIMAFITDKNLTSNPNTSVWYAFAGCIMFYLINLLRYSKESTVFASVLTLITYFSVNIYNEIPVALIIQITIPLVLFLYIGYLVTSSSKSMMIEANTKMMMERYLPPQLVQELYKESSSIMPGGSIKKVSVLFADIKSFTSISESMPPVNVVELLNAYLTAMTEIIFAHKGTIDKFIGDAIMTVFGAPITENDDALRSVQTALAMQKAMKEFFVHTNGKDVQLEIGIGIHTGDVIAGNIGSEKRVDYTIIGDNVNIASRIEGLTRFYRCDVLISEATYDEIKDCTGGFSFREVDLVQVKGRSLPVRIYEVRYFENKHEKDLFEKTARLFEQALILYRKRDFENSRIIFMENKDDSLSGIFAHRCTEYLVNPPDDGWQGVFSMKSK